MIEHQPDSKFRENLQIPFNILTNKGEQFLWDDSGVKKLF
jgi:hypothetical protein